MQTRADFKTEDYPTRTSAIEPWTSFRLQLCGFYCGYYWQLYCSTVHSPNARRISQVTWELSLSSHPRCLTTKCWSRPVSSDKSPT